MYNTKSFAKWTGGEFILAKLKVPETGKIYFTVTEEGLPTKLQRTFFGEVYYVMAMAGLYRITKNKKYLVSKSLIYSVKK